MRTFPVIRAFQQDILLLTEFDQQAFLTCLTKFLHIYIFHIELMKLLESLHNMDLTIRQFNFLGNISYVTYLYMVFPHYHILYN